VDDGGVDDGGVDDGGVAGAAVAGAAAAGAGMLLPASCAQARPSGVRTALPASRRNRQVNNLTGSFTPNLRIISIRNR
jgi:hypothetical protein